MSTNTANLLGVAALGAGFVVDYLWGSTVSLPIFMVVLGWACRGINEGLRR